jgi:hypothetical protein
MQREKELTIMANCIKLFTCVFLSGLCAAIAASSIPVPSQQNKTIQQALAFAKKGDTVLVAPGKYRGSLTVPSGVTVACREIFKAEVTVSGAEKAVSLTNGSSITGFDISGGIIGVYSGAPGNSISMCRIHGNSKTGIMCVGHLPKIEDNIIAFNGASGIQGWDVRSTIASVNHNSICYNGNNGVAVGGNSSISIENCIISFNEKIGVKADPGVKVTMRRNCFFGNSDIVESFPADNFSYDPLFVSARKLDFLLSTDSPCRNMGNDNQNIGMRFQEK